MHVEPSRIRRLTPVLALLWLLLQSAAPAWGATPEDPLAQQSTKQEQIRTSASRVGQQLDQVLTEFDLNGISGEDVKVLKAIRGVLHRLTEEEMQTVLRYLGEARKDANPAAQQVAEAFSGQRNIITQLRQLLSEYQRQQAVYDIAQRLRELATRQTDNMRLAVWLSRQVERKDPSQFQETQRLNLQLQETEETSLRAETAQVIEQLDRLVQQSGDAATAERSRKALDLARDSGLLKSVETAVNDLKAARMLGAAGNEKRARDQMREVARLLTQSLDKRDALREAIRELDAAMDRQRSITDTTRKLATREEATKRETEQAEVVDSSDLVRKDVTDLAPAAAEHLQAATDRMQDARGALSSGDSPTRVREQAVAQQIEALTKMEQARRELIDQLNKADAPPALPEKALAAIDALMQRVRELIQRQETLKKTTAGLAPDKLTAQAPPQGDIKDATQETQKLASSPSPEAAEALQEAAGHMQLSQKSLADGKNQPEAQQAALDALSRAERALVRQQEALEKAKEELAGLEVLLQKLIAIILDQQDLFNVTAKAAAKSQKTPMPVEVNQQLVLGERTRQLSGEVQKPVPKAAEHLDSAGGVMNHARELLTKPDPADAQPKQSAALKELYAARKEIERKINQLKDELGEDSEDSGSLEDAADAIAQAQKDTQEALAQLQKGAANAMQTLKEKQEQVSADLAQPMLEAPATKVAKRESDAAAKRLGSADLASAIASMKAALQAMKQGIQANQPLVTEGAPNMPTVAESQQEVLKLAETLSEGMKNASKDAMQKAAQALDRAGKKIRPLSSGKNGKLPAAAQNALEAAQEDLDNGSAEAGEMQGQQAQGSAQRASQNLAQAQAAIALAQSGLGSDSQQQQAGNSQGQGKKPGQGKTKRGQQGQPGPQGDGREGNWRGQGGADGVTQNVTGSSRFTGLPARDRAAIQQSQGESYPQEYAPLVEQYLRNLSDQAEPK